MQLWVSYEVPQPAVGLCAKGGVVLLGMLGGNKNGGREGEGAGAIAAIGAEKNKGDFFRAARAETEKKEGRLKQRELRPRFHRLAGRIQLKIQRDEKA